MTVKRLFRTIVLTFAICCLVTTTGSANPNESGQQDFNRELHKVKYNYATALSTGELNLDEIYADENGAGGIERGTGHKSPGKAFLMSLVVPGLGQYYYGSKVKPIAFLGVEAASWIVHVSWHNKGEKLTDEFEAFNNQHWSQSRYEDYLAIAYGVRDDELVTGAPEVSHNLPDTKTQQYYEMTGKYNQFAWGWDDATLNGMTYADFDSAGGFPQPITSELTKPNSSNRLLYETMRNDANKKLDDANKVLMVILANHLISAVEAYITTKSRNESNKTDSEFSNFKFKPSLRSYNSRSDTPYLNVSYKF